VIHLVAEAMFSIKTPAPISELDRREDARPLAAVASDEAIANSPIFCRGGSQIAAPISSCNPDCAQPITSTALMRILVQSSPCTIPR